jgi:type I restriction enzyme R subunit
MSFFFINLPNSCTDTYKKRTENFYEPNWTTSNPKPSRAIVSTAIGLQLFGQLARSKTHIEQELLQAFLKKPGYSQTLISKTLYELGKFASAQSKSLYDINKAVYHLLRYSIKVKEKVGTHKKTVWLINWKKPLTNDFAIAEEVTITGENTKRPDIVLYINGIALGVLELKRSTVSVLQGIRQNLDNQKSRFIKFCYPTITHGG